MEGGLKLCLCSDENKVKCRFKGANSHDIETLKEFH